jgi:hypothetical protein
MKASRCVIVIKFQVDAVKLTGDKDPLFYWHYRLGTLFACTSFKVFLPATPSSSCYLCLIVLEFYTNDTPTHREMVRYGLILCTPMLTGCMGL